MQKKPLYYLFRKITVCYCVCGIKRTILIFDLQPKVVEKRPKLNGSVGTRTSVVATRGAPAVRPPRETASRSRKYWTGNNGFSRCLGRSLRSPSCFFDAVDAAIPITPKPAAAHMSWLAMPCLMAPRSPLSTFSSVAMASYSAKVRQPSVPFVTS